MIEATNSRQADSAATAVAAARAGDVNALAGWLEVGGNPKPIHFAGHSGSIAVSERLLAAVGPDGEYHGGVGKTRSTILDYPFLTGRSTQDSRLVGELMVEVLEHGLRKYGWK